MRILLLSNEYPPFIFGGIGTFTKGLAQGLSRIGVDVTVITGYPESNILNAHHVQAHKSFQKGGDGVTIIRFPYPNLPPRHTMFQLSNLKRIRKTVEEINPDVIHGQSGSTFPASCVLRSIAPLIVTFHTSPKTEEALSNFSLLRGGSWTDFFTYVVGYPAWSFTFRKELDYSAISVAVSKALRSDLLNEMGEAYTEKLHCVHNGVDLDTLDKEYKSETGSEESDDTILFAGRLFWRKGALNIIKMAYLLQKKKTKFKILVHGTGPLFNKMREYIISLKLKNIELKGFTTRQELMKSIRQCKFVAIPSMYEACPMILLESMCLGKIPLMLKLPFSSELTEGGKYGILGDGINNLTDRLIELENTHSSNQLGNSISVFARDVYDVNKATHQYVEIYRDLISHYHLNN